MSRDRSTERVLPPVASDRRRSEILENPLSGERVTILRPGNSSSDALVWELVLAPGGQVPSRHVHPNQKERFEVFEGELEFRVARLRLRVPQGRSVTIPPGMLHHFANRGPVPAKAWVHTVPALDMEDLLRTAATMAQQQCRAGRRFPHLVDLALFMREFEAEVSSPWAPKTAAFATRTAARLARLLGCDRRYRQLRDASDGRRDRPT